MKLILDTENQTLAIQEKDATRTFDLYSDEAFTVLAQQWLKVGWNQKYSYTFSWLGRPIIQLPEDMIRMQELIYHVQPGVIVETGIAHGGSLIFYASLCHTIGKGRVIGIDIDIRPHNRTAIENHLLARYITLIEGSSTDSAILRQVKALIAPQECVMIILDSNHSYRHVLDELQHYSAMVTPSSYLIVNDCIMRDLYDVPRGRPDWQHDNPAQAVSAFITQHPEFIQEQPAWPFNESTLRDNLTYYPGGWLRRRELNRP
jgi:cephalosporin hydroxylase